MKLFERFRAKRRNVYEGLFSARALCISGLIIMPALLFNPVLFFRFALFLFFWFLAWLSGRKNNPLFTILVILFIVVFNLIFPSGQVIYTIGAFRITSGALMLGFHRAITLSGLLMLSRVTIRQDLKIPGLFGELIGESFRIFSVIMNQKHRITRKNLISDIDRMMVELSGDSAGALQPDTAVTSGTRPLGYFVIAAVVILSWLPMIFFYWPAIMNLILGPL